MYDTLIERLSGKGIVHSVVTACAECQVFTPCMMRQTETLANRNLWVKRYSEKSKCGTY